MGDTNNTKEKLKRSLTEWHEFTVPSFVSRDFDHVLVTRERIVSIIGPRRAGKTYVCFEIMDALARRGVPRENIVYINFEDERLVPLDGSELTFLLDVQTELFGYEAGKPRYCFIDEVHAVPNWSKWVRRITDQNANLTVVITGSSSKMLGAEIATELRGRGSTITVFPYSFSEFLRAKGHETGSSEKLLYSPEQNNIKRHFNEYFRKGGFPAITQVKDYRDTLQQYYRTIFARDMVERFAIKNIRQFEDFLKIQITRFSALSSISNTEKEMREMGYSLSKNTLMNYLGYARDVFLLFDVCKYDFKVTRQLRHPRKLYAVDHGLVDAVRFSFSEDRGRILENIAFMELRRRNHDLYYHAGKTECDFVIRSGRTITQCIQVCWTLGNGEAGRREIKSLLAALHEYKLDEGIILTNDEHATIEQEGKTIRVWPFWYFSLGRKIDQ
jgi:uncharacterized protein